MANNMINDLVYRYPQTQLPGGTMEKMPGIQMPQPDSPLFSKLPNSLIPGAQNGITQTIPNGIFGGGANGIFGGGLSQNPIIAMITSVVQPLIELVTNLVGRLTGGLGLGQIGGGMQSGMPSMPSLPFGLGGVQGGGIMTPLATPTTEAATPAQAEGAKKEEKKSWFGTLKDVWGGAKELYSGAKDYFKDFSFSKIGDYVSDAWGAIKSFF